MRTFKFYTHQKLRLGIILVFKLKIYLDYFFLSLSIFSNQLNALLKFVNNCRPYFTLGKSSIVNVFFIESGFNKLTVNFLEF